MTAKKLEFELCPIAREHLEAVAEIESLCFAEPWSARALELLLGNAAVGAVAICEGRIAAYGGMLIAPDEGQITNIAVHPDFRRCGLGRAILLSLQKEATARGLLQIALEVRASNEAAIALYRSEHYYVAGRRRNFYRNPTEDALVMLCDVSVGSGDRSDTF